MRLWAIKNMDDESWSLFLPLPIAIDFYTLRVYSKYIGVLLR
jgi:hypothetical protein